MGGRDPQMPAATIPSAAIAEMSLSGRYLVLVCAFLGWFFAGTQMSITSLAMRPAAVDLLSATGRIDRALVTLKVVEQKKLTGSQAALLKQQNGIVGRWTAWYTCAFLFGAAAGGWVFGRVGDRFGRAKGMGLSILCFTALSAVAYFARTPEELLLLRFFACFGVGGMWPNGVALAAEAWSNVSRPMLAGIIGASANVGIVLMALMAVFVKITPDDWRWLMLLVSTPIVLAFFSLLAVPESPRWLAAQLLRNGGGATATNAVQSHIFRPPLLKITLIGIALGTVPILGGWGSANWAIPWADKVGSVDDPFLKAQVLLARSFPGTVSSFLGGWVASHFGRKRSYFLISLSALATAQTMFWFFTPADGNIFLALTALLGFFSGIYFGWLPLCLPEFFPTSVRSTGAGVSFNFGRVLTAFAVLGAGGLLHYFNEDYAQVGRITSLIFAVGVFIIWLAPDTDQTRIDD